jgi:hypothetical protein
LFVLTSLARSLSSCFLREFCKHQKNYELITSNFNILEMSDLSGFRIYPSNLFCQVSKLALYYLPSCGNVSSLLKSNALVRFERLV